MLDPATRFAAAVGPAAPEGTYTYRLTKGKEVYEGTVAVAYDPDYPHGKTERAEQQAIVSELYDMLARLAYVCRGRGRVPGPARERADELKEEDKLATSCARSPTTWTPSTPP